MSGKLGLASRLVRKNARFFTTSEARCITREEVEKIKQKQAFYQSKDEPVHMIGSGKIHYYITCAVGAVVIVSGVHSIYKILNHGKA